MNISLAMIIKNEEKFIERCLQSVNGLVDEIVIVDTGSTDHTLEILKKYQKINLYRINWCDDFSKARNYSIDKANGDYILVLDADEYITSGTRENLESIMSQKYIGRILINSSFKKENEEHQSKVYVSRFFPRNIQYVGEIHEQLDTNYKRVKTDLIVQHDGYIDTNKSQRNIPLLLKTLKRNPNDPYYLYQLGKELRLNKQLKESYHFLMKSYEKTKKNSSYYGDLVIELIYSGKEDCKEDVIKIINQNEKILNNLTDYHFAKGLYYLDYCIKFPTKAHEYIQKIESSFLTCLQMNDKEHIEYMQGTSSFLAAYNLGLYYEVTDNYKKALFYYTLSSQDGYEPAKRQLGVLERNKNK